MFSAQRICKSITQSTPSWSYGRILGMIAALNWTVLTIIYWFAIQPKVLRQSVFGIVLGNEHRILENQNPVSWQDQIVTCLASGAIPVLIGHGQFPFDEAIPSNMWNRATVHFQLKQISQLFLALNSISKLRIMEMRRIGQMIYNRYLGSREAQMRSVLLTLSQRDGKPQPPAPVTNFRLVSSNPGRKLYIYEESSETPLVAKHNDFHRFPIYLTEVSEKTDPYWFHDSTPWSTISFTELAYTNNHSGGDFYSDLLGLEYPKEEFTVIMPVYNRLYRARKTIEGFRDVPHIHSVLVVFNNPNLNPADTEWPTINVPLKILRFKRNSLNNRFLPNNQIETEAVLAIDDDSCLTADEITFGFKTWRTNRASIVGQVSRSFTTEDKNLSYPVQCTPSYSMVLTNAAFLHKYYLHAYTWEMPGPIRQMVDEYMNGEDIAMNFLVSHISRKPPIRINNRCEIQCFGVINSLSFRLSHGEQRSKILNKLVEQFGYNPLLFSAYQARSFQYPDLHLQVFLDRIFGGDNVG
ncbi:unnamed protein product [Calicophoron daubneyi]|uniref:Glycosyl transferase 64 domain-containing protein n=1 Tax=Calicophoron daubneyi TaxID=300641 RepID=A0AAV2TNJ7_CALDB